MQFEYLAWLLHCLPHWPLPGSNSLRIGAAMPPYRRIAEHTPRHNHWQRPGQPE